MDQTENQESNNNFSSGFSSIALLVWDFLKIVIVALIIIVPIRYFIFQPFIVSGSSMLPNFQNGEYLIIDELSYYFHQPQRGDVVVLKPPVTVPGNSQHNEYYIKRIIGLPGEKIEIDNGKVIIFNAQHPEGITIDEPYLPNQSLTYPHDASIIGGKKTVTLANDEYFMLGDNRLASSDSRDWGILNRKDMVGKVFMRALPLTNFEIYTKSPTYSF